ncbi:TerB family tellurite resistance protein [candidate division KSB1 bacterium]
MSRKFTGTLIGAAAGLFMSGSILGGIIGGVLGNMMDKSGDISQRRRPRSRPETTGRDAHVREFVFVSNLVALMTSVAKADKEIHPSEIHTITDYFQKSFHYSGHDRSVIENLIRESAARPLDLQRICADTCRLLDYPERLMLLRMLYVVAISDNVVKQMEKERIEKIASYLRISDLDHGYIKNEFSPDDSHDYYKILEVAPSASDAELKTAYREKVKKFHPDKVSHLGKDFADLASEKFRKIQDAYDKIAKERNL